MAAHQQSLARNWIDRAAKQKNAKAECYAKGYPVGEKNETPRTRHGSSPLVDTNNRLRVPVLYLRRLGQLVTSRLHLSSDSRQTFRWEAIESSRNLRKCLVTPIIRRMGQGLSIAGT